MAHRDDSTIVTSAHLCRKDSCFDPLLLIVGIYEDLIFLVDEGLFTPFGISFTFLVCRCDLRGPDIKDCIILWLGLFKLNLNNLAMHLGHNTKEPLAFTIVRQ